MAAQNSGKTAMPEGRRFKKGASGNPGGRPSTRELTEALKKIVKPAELAKELKRLALKAKEETVRLAAIRYVYDRVEGTPMHRTELTLDDLRDQTRALANAEGATEDEAEDAVRYVEALYRGEHTR